VKDLFDPFEESIIFFKYHYGLVRPPMTSNRENIFDHLPFPADEIMPWESVCLVE